MLTVACLLVRGHVGFTAEYVIRLRSMVGRKISQPHRFVCLTDQPEVFAGPLGAGIETIRVNAMPDGIFAWWAKIELFNRAHGIKGRVLYLDLDVLAVRDLDPVADFPALFALIPHAGQWTGKGQRRVIRRYNSSVMVFDVCDRLHMIYDRWTPEITERLWGDQDWIAYNFPDEATMPLEWFPRLSAIAVDAAGARWPKEARVVLCKKPKNHDARQRWPWFDQAWR